MPTNGINHAEDADMADCDGEKVVTMMDVLQEQQDFEDDANAVLGASDEKNCTYSKGYIKRQAIYACLTCCSDAKEDPTKRAGVCLACSLNCHENHELIELYTKRNFRCDCGNPKFNTHPCQYTPNKCDLNLDNKYNQNFSGLYCNCHRPYPDPEATEEEEMIQCIICEDWLHASHLDAVVPGNDQYSEMICKACMDNNDFLHDYNKLAVNIEAEDVDVTNLNESNNRNGDLEDEKHLNGVTVEDVISKPADLNVGEEAEKSSMIENSTLENQPLEECLEANALNVSKDKETDLIEKPQLEVNTEENSVNEFKEGDDKKQSMGEVSADVNTVDKDTDIATNIVDTNNLINTENIESKDKSSENVTPKESSNPEEVTNNTDLNGENIKDSTENINAEVEAKSNNDITESENAEMDTNSGTKESDSIKEPDTETETGVGEGTGDEAGENKSEIDGEQASDEAENTKMEVENNSSLTSPNENEIAASIQETREEIPESQNKTEEVETDEDSNRITTDQDMNGDVDQEPNEVPEGSSTLSTEKCENVTHTNAIESNGINENKRKLSTDELIDENLVKKPKIDDKDKCIRPNGVKRILKGAVFWPSNFRQKLCTCSECLTMYKDLNVLFLIDPEDTVFAYETLGKEKVDGRPTQYEKGLEALSSLDRIQQINALTEYNKMRDKLLDYLKSFKDKNEIVKEEDIKAFFAGMKPKREPDGVYFCR